MASELWPALAGETALVWAEPYGSPVGWPAPCPGCVVAGGLLVLAVVALDTVVATELVDAGLVAAMTGVLVAEVRWTGGSLGRCTLVTGSWWRWVTTAADGLTAAFFAGPEVPVARALTAGARSLW